jgi:hypothetical protein
VSSVSKRSEEEPTSACLSRGRALMRSKESAGLLWSLSLAVPALGAVLFLLSALLRAFVLAAFAAKAETRSARSQTAA